MTPRDQTETLKDRADRLAKDAGDTLADAAREQGDRARDAAADQADQFADAARDARRNFDPSSLQAEALRAVSQQIEGMTRHLRERPVTELIDDAAVFARRNPLLVLGGAAVLGFAAARFLKADGPTHHVTSDDPWSTSSDPYDRGES